MLRDAKSTAADRLASVFKSGLFGLGLLTFFVDVLLLVQPIYMLQVYDRVLTSASVETLIFISLIAIGAIVLLGFIDGIRSMLAARLAARMQVEAGSDALVAAMNGPRASLGDVQPLRDLATVRGFIANRGLLAYLDLPFAPLFIGILYFIHPHLFFLTAAGAVVLGGLALLNQWATADASTDAGEQTMGAMLAATAFARNAESIQAMGMVGNVIRAWGRKEAASLRSQDRANQRNAVFASISRVLRLGLQIAILGYGGYLVLNGQMTAGMIFSASLISGRGLQPIDQVIGGWKGFVDARKAWTRLKDALGKPAGADASTQLPTPLGRLTLDQVVVFAPNPLGSEPLLKRISFEVAPGECCAVIGPSGAGKSTLVRTIIGALQPRGGTVRIDGADIRSWRRDQLGAHVGYLSQDVDLLPGTVAENIARFHSDIDDSLIVSAARKAQVHELILGLGNGYDTLIGPGGQQLSGGQRQRIGLARAFYGWPKLLVLDEPNANLDTDGDLALDRAIQQAKLDGIAVVIVTQRRPIAERADTILVLRDGAIEDFGRCADVIGRQAQKIKAAQDARKNVAAIRLAQPGAAPRAQAQVLAVAADPKTT